MFRFLKWLIIILLLLALGLALVLKLRYGGGEAFPDRSGEAVLDWSAVETVANLAQPPGNIAVAPNGRVFITQHPEARPQIKVAELVDGQPVAWPNLAFQTGGEAGEEEPNYFQDVLSIRIDQQNRLWALDNAMHGIGQTRLLAFDLDSKAIVYQHEFSREHAGLGSHLNDLQVSPDGEWIYIADASFFAQTPAILVHHITSGETRRLLENHVSVQAEDYLPVVQGRKMQAFGLVTIRPGVDSIALNRDGSWLVFGAITAKKMYGVPTIALQATFAAEPTSPEAAVVAWADKTMSDGITTDNMGNVYLSDLENSAIHRLNTQGKLTTLLKDERIRWPDGFSFGPDGWLYFTCSSLHQVIGLPRSSIQEHSPYQVYRFKPGLSAVAGH